MIRAICWRQPWKQTELLRINRMGLRQKNNCDWDKNAGEIRLLFCPSVCPKASRENKFFWDSFLPEIGTIEPIRIS